MADNYSYFKATDAINSGLIFRLHEDTYKWEEYNIGTQTWCPSYTVMSYLDPESAYADYFKAISTKEADKLINADTTKWKNVWQVTKQLLDEHASKLKSPVKAYKYKEYVQWLSEYMTNERERILIVLSRFYEIPNYEDILKKAGIPDSIIKAVSLYSAPSAVLCQRCNNLVYRTVQQELSRIYFRDDLVDAAAITTRYNELRGGYNEQEAYTESVL